MHLLDVQKFIYADRVKKENVLSRGSAAQGSASFHLTLSELKTLEDDKTEHAYALEWYEIGNDGKTKHTIPALLFTNANELELFIDGIRCAHARIKATAEEREKMNEVRYPEPVLCYVHHRYGQTPQAWFTTRQLDRQWGDDWDDSYALNAEPPYAYGDHMAAQGIEPWVIHCVEFVSPFCFAQDWPGPGDLSVQRIYKEHIPWLFTSSVKIYAGCPLREFREKIAEVGGDIGREESILKR